MIEEVHKTGQMLLEASFTRKLQPSEELALRGYCEMFRVVCRYIELQHKRELADFGIDLFMPPPDPDDDMPYDTDPDSDGVGALD